VPPPPPPIPTAPPPPATPEVFFDRVKRAIDDRDAWEEFLKLLSLFSTDVIEEDTLLQMAAPFLGGEGSELESQFRDILGIERAQKVNMGEMPKTAGHAHGYGHPTGMGSAYMSGPKYKYGPSYRRLPDSVSISSLLLRKARYSSSLRSIGDHFGLFWPGRALSLRAKR
jgi:paired amphipathic helix protein Sin3a